MKNLWMARKLRENGKINENGTKIFATMLEREQYFEDKTDWAPLIKNHSHFHFLRDTLITH